MRELGLFPKASSVARNLTATTQRGDDKIDIDIINNIMHVKPSNKNNKNNMEAIAIWAYIDPEGRIGGSTSDTSMVLAPYTFQALPDLENGELGEEDIEDAIEIRQPSYYDYQLHHMMSEVKMVAQHMHKMQEAEQMEARKMYNHLQEQSYAVYQNLKRNDDHTKEKLQQLHEQFARESTEFAKNTYEKLQAQETNAALTKQYSNELFDILRKTMERANEQNRQTAAIQAQINEQKAYEVNNLNERVLGLNSEASKTMRELERVKEEQKRLQKTNQELEEKAARYLRKKEKETVNLSKEELEAIAQREIRKKVERMTLNERIIGTPMFASRQTTPC